VLNQENAMNVSDLVREFVNLQVRAAALDPGEQDRREILRLALRLAEVSVPPSIVTGGVHLRFHDGAAAREICLERVLQPVIEVALQSGVSVGDRLVVIIEPAPGSPAIAARATVVGPAPKGEGVVKLDLGNDVVRQCVAEAEIAAMQTPTSKGSILHP
jgi:hypothetical protein